MRYGIIFVYMHVRAPRVSRPWGGAGVVGVTDSRSDAQRELCLSPQRISPHGRRRRISARVLRKTEPLTRDNVRPVHRVRRRYSRRSCARAHPRVVSSLRGLDERPPPRALDNGKPTYPCKIIPRHGPGTIMPARRTPHEYT